MVIRNLTPHPINIVGGCSLPPEGVVARVAVSYRHVATVEGIDIFKAEYGDVENLPGPQPDTLLVVSGMVRAAESSRPDLLSPGQLVRDAEGRVIGCEGLIASDSYKEE